MFQRYYSVIHACQNMFLGGALIFCIYHGNDYMITEIISLAGRRKMSFDLCHFVDIKHCSEV